MPWFKKEPIAIQAIRYTGDNIEEIWDTFGEDDIFGPVEGDPCAYIITLEGKMRCNVGDWIIRGVQGEVYPCRHDIFLQTYRKVGS